MWHFLGIGLPVFRYSLVSRNVSFWIARITQFSAASSSGTVIYRGCGCSSLSVLSFQLMNLLSLASAQSGASQFEYCCHSFWHPCNVVLVVARTVVRCLQTSAWSGSSSGISLSFGHLFSGSCRNLGAVFHLLSSCSSLADTPRDTSSAGLSSFGTCRHWSSVDALCMVATRLAMYV